MKIILLHLFFFLTITVFSQDVIVKTDGEKLEVVVIEITTQTIKYKDFSNQEGPVKIIEVRNVNEIIYEDGQFDTFNKLIESPITKKSNAKYGPLHIMGSGFGLDLIPGYGAVTRFKYAYNPNNPNEPWDRFLSNHFTLSFRISNKFYFDVKPKWRTGIMINWVRLGFSTGLSNSNQNGFLQMAPLNIGTTNIIKLSENTAIEANFGFGTNFSLDFKNENGDITTMFNPEVKFRYKVFAIGLDYTHSQIFGNQNENRYNIASVVLGLKF